MAADLASLFVALRTMSSEEQERALADVPDAAIRSRLRAMLGVRDDDDRLEPDPESGVAAVVAEEIRRGEAVPERLGAFKVIQLVGRGGMGVVYEAEEQLPRRAVALKTLVTADPKAVARFEEECQAMALVDHPAVPVVYQMFHDQGRPVLVMELVRGGPFLEGVRGLSFDDRIRLLIELARAVHEIHRRGIVHRDLKPGNLLISRSGAVRILDFGVASIGQGYVPGSGTVAYMPPEQRRGAPPDPRNDVYSLGAIALRVLTGSGDAADQTWQTGIDGTDRPSEVEDLSVLAPTLPASLAAILTAALERDPVARTASAEDFADALDGWLEAELLRMLAATAPESGPAGGGAIRRRAVDTTLAVMRRTLADTPAMASDIDLWRDELQQLSSWMSEGVRAVSLYGLPGTDCRSLQRALLDQVGEELGLFVDAPEGPLLSPLARALGTEATWPSVKAVLRGLGAAVICIRGHTGLVRDLLPLLPLAPDVRWLVSSTMRMPHTAFRPMQLLGVDAARATERVVAHLEAQGVPADPEGVAALVDRVDGIAALVHASEELAHVHGVAGVAALPMAALGAPWQAIVARLDKLIDDDLALLSSLAVLPHFPLERDVRDLLGDDALRLQGLVDRGVLVRRWDRLGVPRVVVAWLTGVLGEGALDAPMRAWLDWLLRRAEEVGDDWIHCRVGMERRLDDIAPHVEAALPHLSPAELHRVAAELSDGLILVGHRALRASIDEAVLRVTPDPHVSRDASLAWVHAIMRKHRRGDMTIVPVLRRIRLEADDADGNLLSQVAHVEASRYAAGNQEPVVAIMRETWERLVRGQQEAWGAWMVGAQAPISLGNGLRGTELLELAEAASASVRREAPDLARYFGQQALSFAWIDFGHVEAGARLGSRAANELAARGLVRLAASFSTYIGKAWYQLERYDDAEEAFRRAADHGAHFHPSHALQWLSLMATEQGDTDSAREHLAAAEAAMPNMEHALLHHHRMCQALRAHADRELVEARHLYRSLIDGTMNVSPVRRSLALAALILLSDDEDERAEHARALRREAEADPVAWSSVALALGDEAVPAGQETRVTPMIRILRKLVQSR